MTDAGCDCDCCVGIHAETPREVSNPPGLPAIRRRVGTHREFLATMDAALGRELAPGVAPLRELAERAPADLTIALLDAWATVADVITFYQERISNESYRRTATERRSLYELARLIGYRPGPGLAAAVDLTFTLDDFPQAPPVHTDLPAGLKVQSVPVASEPAQIYETIEPAVARSEWNELRPLARQRTVLSASAPSVTVAIDAGVVPGDLVLIVDAAGTAALHTVLAVHPDPGAAVVTLDLIRSPGARALHHAHAPARLRGRRSRRGAGRRRGGGAPSACLASRGRGRAVPGQGMGRASARTGPQPGDPGRRERQLRARLRAAAAHRRVRAQRTAVEIAAGRRCGTRPRSRS